MKIRIETKAAFSMFGIERVFSTENGQNLVDIPKFWNACFEDGRIEALEKVSGIEVTDAYEGLLAANAVMGYKATGGQSFPYMIGSLLKTDSQTIGYEIVDIPSMKWGVFISEPFNVDGITPVVQGLWKEIFSEWLPASQEEMVDGPQLEMYYKGNAGKEYCEVWIPLK